MTRINEEKLRKIKEAYAVLAQSVEMVHYDMVHRKSNAPSKIKRIIWLDIESLRICVDTIRPTIAERMLGKISPGIYLRDIAEIRDGFVSYDFLNNLDPPVDPDCCFSIIGSERTISVELPNRMARDWFVERLRLLRDDVLSENDKRSRNILATINVRDKTDIDAAHTMSGILKRGIQVHHHSEGQIIKSVLSFDSTTACLVLTPLESSWISWLFFLWAPSSIILDIDDISEIRQGTHSFSFVRTNSLERFSECLSIIGTRCTLDLQFASSVTRNTFASRLASFVTYHQQVEDPDL